MRPTLHTERLILRPFAAADADAVTRLASAREIAATTLSIPHPYERGFAETWIASHQDQFAASGSIVLAITLREDRSEEHTSELQSRENLVCRLLLDKNH